MSRILGLGAALGAMFALTSVTAAGDDILRLDLRKSAKITLASGTSATSEFTHDARAKATDDDIEDVHLRYGLGYARGAYGGHRYLPRFYAYRSGYAAGSGYGHYGLPWRRFYGGGYYGGHYGGYYGARYAYPAFSAYYAPAYYAPAYYASTYYYSEPLVYDYPCGGSDVGAATETLNLPQHIAPTPQRLPLPAPRGATPPMPRADEPPLANQPGERIYPYDGPAPKAAPPSYRYNGDPSAPVPMPPPDVNPSKSSPKDGGAEGRIVKLAPAKPTYQAYGDNRRKTDNGDKTVVVKRTND